MQYLVERYDTEYKISYPKGTREYYEMNNWLFYQNAGLGPMQGQASKWLFDLIWNEYETRGRLHNDLRWRELGEDAVSTQPQVPSSSSFDCQSCGPDHLRRTPRSIRCSTYMWRQSHEIPLQSEWAWAVFPQIRGHNTPSSRADRSLDHFSRYAPERIEYGVNRYVNETRRLYSVLDKHLAADKRPYLVGDKCTIAGTYSDP
jgi:glutathione S-transferase